MFFFGKRMEHKKNVYCFYALNHEQKRIELDFLLNFNFAQLIKVNNFERKLNYVGLAV